MRIGSSYNSGILQCYLNLISIVTENDRVLFLIKLLITGLVTVTN